jgi:hypothetical protein
MDHISQPKRTDWKARNLMTIIILHSEFSWTTVGQLSQSHHPSYATVSINAIRLLVHHTGASKNDATSPQEVGILPHSDTHTHMRTLWWRVPTPFNKKNNDHNQKCRELRMTLVPKPWLQNSVGTSQTACSG